ncbi:MAG: UvrD-helicase domain-containing protein [Flavobacteriaceae bacterium]|nr:UvrD-helicase domain-containing protein [Flavobacteriaceae bacterium]
MTSYLDNLNNVQKQAVLQKEGAMIIIAGAGSGKTRVLTYRIAHLMHQGVDPFNILALTFTNKAAREMKNRIAKIVGESEAKNLWMGTFHSIFARILRSEADKLGFPTNFTIYDTQDSAKLLGSIIKEMELDTDRYKAKQVLNRISQFKNSLITVKAYQNNSELQEADRQASRPKMGEIYKNYVDRCFKAGCMDFDDLLLRTNQLLSQFPEVLNKYQNKFRYILVDEYQDTNHSQYLIVKALSDRFQNICVVGDDSQSIYAFRGANINNILNFQRDFDDVKIFKLEQNYRSTKNIVQASNSVIKNNKSKLDKDIWTSNTEGDKVKIMHTSTDGEEGRYVANTIFDVMMQKQAKNTDFAILYRTNAQSRSLEDALRKKGIDYRIYGGLSFYQRKEVKDVLSYLRLLANPKDEEALKRVINYPARGIGQTTIEKLIVAANKYNRSIYTILENIDRVDIGVNMGTKTKLQNFITMMQSFQIFAQDHNAFDTADHIVKQVHILKDLDKDSTPEGISRIENIQELLNGIKDFIDKQTEEDLDISLGSFLEDVALATDFDNDKKGNKESISLMTIHAAKGLEFPYVFIVGLEENLFPSAMSMNTRAELEEERRLFYVALTRAQKAVYLSLAHTRFRWGKLVDAEPSRFLGELDEKYTEVLAKPRQKNTGNLFDDFDQTKTHHQWQAPKNTIRFKKATNKTTPKPKPLTIPKNLKKITGNTNHKTNLFDTKLTVGNSVKHARFGIGKVVNLEGVGANIKAEINFKDEGIKKLLLKFAKLKIIG